MAEEEVLLVADDSSDEEVLITDDSGGEEEIISDATGTEEVSENIISEELPEDTTEYPVRKVKFGVKSKLVLSTTLLISVITLIIGFYLLNTTKSSLLKEMRLRGRIVANNLAKSITEILDDDTSRHQIILETSKINDIDKIMIFDNNLNIIDHSDKDLWSKILLSKFDESVKKVNIKLPKRISEIVKNKNFYQEEDAKQIKIYIPIKFENTPIGIANIIFTKKFINEKLKKVQTKIIIFIIIALIVGILSAYMLATYIIKPINNLAKGARIIGSGKLNYKIEVKTADELGALADEFNNMTVRLVKAQKSLVEKERFEEQLEIARNIQVNLLADKFPEIDGIEIDAYYKAAKGVGGDYYDIIHVKEENKIGAIIADVSGKGVPAALVMVMIRTVFHSTFRFVKKTNEAIVNINTGISGRLTGDKFATMFFLIYDYKNGIMEYTNAAHSPLIVYRSKTDEILELDTEGIPVGVDVSAQFGTKSIKLMDGDILVTFTDGITEAMNIKEEMYKSERLKAAIKRNAKLSASEIVKNIITEIDAFVGEAPQHDDMTLLVIKVNRASLLSSAVQQVNASNAVNSKPVNIKLKYMNPIDPYSLLI